MFARRKGIEVTVGWLVASVSSDVALNLHVEWSDIWGVWLCIGPSLIA